MSTGPKLAVSQARRRDHQTSTTVINHPVRMPFAGKEKKRSVATKELVREDVYLTDSTTPLPAPSPMAAAHSQRMREMGYPVEMMADKAMAKRTMRDTVQEILKHRTLDRQLQIEMNRQRSHMQAEARQLRKNLSQLKSRSTSPAKSSQGQHSNRSLHSSVEPLPNGTITSRNAWKVATGRIVALKKLQKPKRSESREETAGSGDEEARLCYAIDAVRMSQDPSVLPDTVQGSTSARRRPVRRHTVDASGTMSKGRNDVRKQHRWYSVSGASSISPDLMVSFPNSPVPSQDTRKGSSQSRAFSNAQTREGSVHSVRELGLNWQLPSRDSTPRARTGKLHRDHKPLTSELDKRRKEKKNPQTKVSDEK